MKNLLSLNKVQVLSKIEQQSINGAGRGYCCEWCSDGTCSGWTSSPNIPCPFAAAC